MGVEPIYTALQAFWRLKINGLALHHSLRHMSPVTHTSQNGLTNAAVGTPVASTAAVLF